MISIYLAGKILKGDEIGVMEDWRNNYIEKLSVFSNVTFVSPDDPTLDESNLWEIFGHDCFQVKEADVIIVNATKKLGVGTAQEMVIAKYFKKHVITVLPKETHHRRKDLNMHGIVIKDWVHPFISSMSDYIFESLDQVVYELNNNGRLNLAVPPKGIEVIDEAISSYSTKRHLCV